MTPEERQILFEAIGILQSVYSGINPINGSKILPIEASQQDSVREAIFVAIRELTSLAKKKTYAEKVPFSATYEQVSCVETRAKALTLGTFAGKINSTIDADEMRGLKESDITEWLLLNNYISKESEEVIITEDYYSVSPKGELAGIIEVERPRQTSVSPIHQLKLAKEGQQLIKNQIEAISSCLRNENSVGITETETTISQVWSKEESNIINYKDCEFCQHNGNRQAGDCHVIYGDAETCPDYRFISSPTEAEREAYNEFNRRKNSNRLRREGGMFKLEEDEG